MDKNNQTFKFTRAVITSLVPIDMDAPFYDSTMGPFDKIKLTHWLQLHDEDGNIGQAGCSEFMEKNVLPLIMTGKEMTYKEIYHMVYWANRNRGFSSETFSDIGKLDYILHDIMAKRAGQPLHRFLGAKKDWVNVYASGHGTNTTTEALINEAKAWKALGYTTYKMKVGTDFGTKKDLDVERVGIMREVIGSDAKLALDANQIWNAEEALDFAKRVEKHNIYWFEEPVHSHDLVELEKLTKSCPFMVSMGESMRSHHFFHAYVKAGVKHLQHNGYTGFEDWCKVRDLAKENGLLFSSGGSSWISAFMATADESCMCEYLKPTNGPLNRLMKIRPIEKAGRFELPTNPGASFVLDFEYVDRMNYIQSQRYIYPKP